MQTYYESSHLDKVYYGDTPVNKIYRGNNLIYARDVTLTINPSPSDATVILTATGYTQTGNSITVKHGTNVTYRVSKSGYTTVTNTISVIDDSTLPVSLLNQYVLTIDPIPQNATVTLTATGFVQSGNSIIVDPNTIVHYSVSKEGYVTQQNDITVNSTQTIAVSLSLARHTITINPTPSDATVTFSTGTVSGKTCTVDYGTQVTYTVSKSSYTTQSATITVTSDRTINVTLPYTPYSPNQVLFESGTAGTSTLNLLVRGTYNVILVGGGSGCAAGAWRGLANIGQLSVSGGGSGGYTNKNIVISAGSYNVTGGAGGAGKKEEDAHRTSGYHSVTSGAGGASSIGSLATANGGGAAYAAHDSGTAGAGGSGETANGNAGVQNKKTQTGKYSISASGGAAKYGSYGAGGGGSAKHEAYSVGSSSFSYNHKCSASASNGGAGYVKITFISY